MRTIIHGPPACGKTRNAAKLQKQFGCKHVLDLDEFERMTAAGQRRFAAGNLLLLTTEHPDCLRRRYPNTNIVAFATAMENRS